MNTFGGKNMPEPYFGGMDWGGIWDDRIIHGGGGLW